jgi:hypothetical protein
MVKRAGILLFVSLLWAACVPGDPVNQLFYCDQETPCAEGYFCSPLLSTCVSNTRIPCLEASDCPSEPTWTCVDFPEDQEKLCIPDPEDCPDYPQSPCSIGI